MVENAHEENFLWVTEGKSILSSTNLDFFFKRWHGEVHDRKLWFPVPYSSLHDTRPYSSTATLASLLFLQHSKLSPTHGMFTCYPLHLKLSSLGFLDALCSHFLQGFPQMALLSHVFPNHPIEHDSLACPSTLSCLCHFPHCSAQYSNASCTKERFHLYCPLLYAKFLEFYLVHSRCLKIFLKYYMIYSINQSMNKWFVQCHYNHMPSTTRKVRKKEIGRRNENEARREAKLPTVPLPLCVDCEPTDKVYSRSLEI